MGEVEKGFLTFIIGFPCIMFGLLLVWGAICFLITGVSLITEFFEAIQHKLNKWIWEFKYSKDK